MLSNAAKAQISQTLLAAKTKYTNSVLNPGGTGQEQTEDWIRAQQKIAEDAIKAIPDLLKDYSGDRSCVRLKLKNNTDYSNGFYVVVTTPGNSNPSQVFSNFSGAYQMIVEQCATLNVPLVLDVETHKTYSYETGYVSYETYYLAIKLD